MSRWFRSVVLGPTLALATLAVAEPAGQCPRPAGSEVVVKALRFSDGRSYAFMVTNNGAGPIRSVALAWGGPPYIEATVKTEPVSMGSPSGWRSRTGRGQDPRLPGSHSHPLITYDWIAEDEAAWIQPGRALSGFAVQLPTPREMELAWLRERESRGAPAEPSDLLKDRPINDRLPPQPDLTRVSFLVWQDQGRCAEAVGTVVPDRSAGAGDAEGTLQGAPLQN